jgi:hypothetical protein
MEKRYELIKKYPGSPGVGVEVQWDNFCHSYLAFGLDLKFKKSDVDDHPEYWKLIPEEPKEINLLYGNSLVHGVETCITKGDYSKFKSKEVNDMREALNGKFQSRIKELESEIAGMFTREEMMYFAIHYDLLDNGVPIKTTLENWLAKRLAQRKENKVV